MRHAFRPTGQLTFILATLATILIGCTSGVIHPSDESNGGTSIGDNSGGGEPTGGDPAGGNPAGGNPWGGNQGGANQGGSGQGGSGQAGSGQAGSGQGNNEGQGVFEAPNPWTKNVYGLAKSAKSDTIISWLDSHGGWGSGEMRIDFSIEVLHADDSTPKKSFIATDEFYDPDCDHVPFPTPAGGAIEAEDGYECTQDGDCHLIVVHHGEKKLYEMWRANITGGTFYGGCAAVWDLTRTYPENLRGEGCTSADAGGFPIAAMLPSAAEVKAGKISHAIRFILPNSRISKKVYVHPGSHSTFATSGGPDAPPYGVRFRLRKDFPLESLPSEGARVIARAIQEYGMFLADGGTIALTAQSDRFSEVRWSDVDVDAYSLSSIQVTDMEVVDMGAPIPWNGDCARN
jgi:hypothetical protein